MPDNTLYGLNRYQYNPLTEMGFTNFQWVDKGRLGRASQPNYNGVDEEQSYTMVNVLFLKMKGITCVVSANEYGITAASQQLLTNANIAHHHYSVPDRTAPSAYQLQNAADVIQNTIKKGGAVLVHCGYGQGRTGAFVGAWAMLKCFDAGTRKMSPDEMCNSTFMRANFGVEHPPQVAAVRAAAALPVANPASAPMTFAAMGSPGLPPLPSPVFMSGTSNLGTPTGANNTLTFANFAGGSGDTDISW